MVSTVTTIGRRRSTMLTTRGTLVLATVVLPVTISSTADRVRAIRAF